MSGNLKTLLDCVDYFLYGFKLRTKYIFHLPILALYCDGIKRLLKDLLSFLFTIRIWEVRVEISSSNKHPVASQNSFARYLLDDPVQYVNLPIVTKRQFTSSLANTAMQQQRQLPQKASLASYTMLPGA